MVRIRVCDSTFIAREVDEGVRIGEGVGDEDEIDAARGERGAGDVGKSAGGVSRGGADDESREVAGRAGGLDGGEWKGVGGDAVGTRGDGGGEARVAAARDDEVAEVVAGTVGAGSVGRGRDGGDASRDDEQRAGAGAGHLAGGRDGLAGGDVHGRRARRQRRERGLVPETVEHRGSGCLSGGLLSRILLHRLHRCCE